MRESLVRHSMIRQSIFSRRPGYFSAQLSNQKRSGKRMADLRRPNSTLV